MTQPRAEAQVVGDVKQLPLSDWRLAQGCWSYLELLKMNGTLLNPVAHASTYPRSGNLELSNCKESSRGKTHQSSSRANHNNLMSMETVIGDEEDRWSTIVNIDIEDLLERPASTSPQARPLQPLTPTLNAVLPTIQPPGPDKILDTSAHLQFLEQLDEGEDWQGQAL
jgi:hypothetical protein